MEKYEVVFCQGGYTHVDYVGEYENCVEVKTELERDMFLSGERDFYYIIRRAKN